MPAQMTPQEFAAKWRRSELKETAAYVSHFDELCRVLRHPTPTDLDSKGDHFTFQRAAAKDTGRPGFADVWYRERFGWEYKGKHKDLDAAYRQLLQYRDNLGNPKLLITSDFETFEIHTNFNNTVSEVYRVTLDDIADGSRWITKRDAFGKDVTTKHSGVQVLRACLVDPDELKPEQTPEDLTKEAAAQFGKIADSLRVWHPNSDEMVARFLTRLLFCMFASDVRLLPDGIITEIVSRSGVRTAEFGERLTELFKVMSKGGEFWGHDVAYFNGGLFDVEKLAADIVHVDTENREAIKRADALNWADVEPSVFGTLFERILNPKKRSQLGAHYTSRKDIETIVEPVLMWPLIREWEALVVSLTPSEARGKDPVLVRKRLQEFIDRLGGVRVLDPACGSGNFLYVSLAMLKGLEQKAIAFGADGGVTDLQPKVHPRQLYGIEIDPYAHELASIVVWIGYLQWKHRNGIPFENEIPILEPLDNVKHMDAILDRTDPANPKEPEWPEADVIVGNPPFLGTTAKMRKALKDEYVDALFNIYDGRVKHGADLCCYWHEKARQMIADGKAKRAGLLATQSIRMGASRFTLERIKETGDIFFAQSNRPWTLDGADVRVSMIGFDDGSETEREWNDQNVAKINADLSSATDLTQARRLKENQHIAFEGDKKGGEFELHEAEAKRLLAMAGNPNGRLNSDVIFPWINATDIARRPRKMFIVDFGLAATEEAAAKYEGPFELLKKRGQREKAKLRSNPATWWLHERPRPDMRVALASLDRFIVTPRVAKHRVFVWMARGTLPDSRLCVFTSVDDYSFGVLHSRVHELWALATSSRHGIGNDPTYNNMTCFETFAFPQATEAQTAAIAAAATELNELRENWLNPPADSLSTKELNKRTLTNLYNQRPTWLVNAHKKLDRAVFAAYGWPDNLSDEDILARLLELNLQRDPA